MQTLLLILISLNRLGPWTLNYVSPTEFLRWVDLHNMLTLLFILGVYLLGAGYGNHEVTNYLHARFCPGPATDTLCRIIIYNDDTFSHWVFFAGFILPNVALMLTQVLYPYPGPLTPRDQGLLAFNGLFVAASIFANLAFEQIGLDLYVVALLAALALALMRRYSKQPLLFFYAVAYSLGLVATFIYKMVAA